MATPDKKKNQTQFKPNSNPTKSNAWQKKKTKWNQTKPNPTTNSKFQACKNVPTWQNQDKRRSFRSKCHTFIIIIITIIIIAYDNLSHHITTSCYTDENERLKRLGGKLFIVLFLVWGRARINNSYGTYHTCRQAWHKCVWEASLTVWVFHAIAQFTVLITLSSNSPLQQHCRRVKQSRSVEYYEACWGAGLRGYGVSK